MSKAHIQLKLKPFQTPNFVLPEMPPGERQDGFKVPSFPLSQLSAETLSDMCDAFRATWPEELFKADDPVGPRNDASLKAMADLCDLLVPCWGTLIKRVRAAEVYRILTSCDVKLQCLGTTKDGHPRHPSQLAYATPLVSYLPAGF